MSTRADPQPLLPFHLFDPEADVQIVERRLPHWSQAGAVCFLTWRPIDSLPKDVLDRWFGDRARWLASHGIRPDDPQWRESWKHYTAVRINRRLRQRGRVWQVDGFDHLVRTEAQFEYLRKYIRDNPQRARLKPGEYRHYFKVLS